MFSFEDLEIYEIVNIYALVIGLLYGLIAQRTQFCISGSIKDFVLSKSTRRLASVLVAMLSAIVFSQLSSYVYKIDFTQTIYLQNSINYFTIILGGVLFGIGMMKADGCSSRHLVKFAQGDLHSLVTLVTIAIFAYITAKGMFSYMGGQLQQSELLLALSSYLPNKPLSLYVVIIFLVVMIYKVVPHAKNLLSLSDGLIVGFLVALSWYVTGAVGSDAFTPLALEGLSFVYPSGQALEYFMFFSGSTLSFAISIIFGILTGSFIMSLFNKKYRFGCALPDSGNKLKNSIFGGVLMGVGGILALGCTIGQGLTGLSTLATSSFVAILSIAISAYITGLKMSKNKSLPSCFSFEWRE